MQIELRVVRHEGELARKVLDFVVGKNLTLTLEDLWARVIVSAGNPGQAEVVLEGDEKLIMLQV